jgi:hypothetical protein
MNITVTHDTNTDVSTGIPTEFDDKEYEPDAIIIWPLLIALQHRPLNVAPLSKCLK